MDARLQLRVQRYGWDRAASYYEQFWSRQLQPVQDTLLDCAALQSGDDVLDVACGTGLVTRRAVELTGGKGSVVGTDLSESMLAAARAASSQHELAPTYRQMNAEQLDFPDAGFDVVLCALGLMYVPDPVRAIAEMCRVVRPGGRVVVSVWGARAECGWAEIFPIVERRVASDVCPLFFQLGSGRTLADLMSAAGLQQVQSRHLPAVLQYSTAADAIGAAFAGGPVALAYARFDDEAREAAHAEYLESIKQYRVDGGYEVPGAFVIAQGVTATA
ncbi:MAG: class I SAM-dependent methyltransferase [Gemmatimonadaceae bacterium]|nr:class I SAM-dependent methyltransferase [Gemmatimonadaceae bacterium]